MKQTAMHRMWGLLLAMLLAASVAGCTPLQPEDTKLKLGLIPVLDVLPVYVAEQNGYFAEQGIQVEVVPVRSAQERDVLVQTGQADGVLTDLPSTALLNKDDVRVKAIYTSRRPYPNAPMFRILAGPDTNLTAPADLKDVPIGISQNTVIEYLTDRILKAEGLSADQIAIVEVGAIPVRFEQLMNGNLQAATLPDPLASGAIAAGAKLIADDAAYPQVAQSVLTFRTETLGSKPSTVRKFLAAWDKAVQELNANPEKYRALMVEQGRVPESIKDTFTLPPFPGPGVPSEAEVADVMAWMREKGLLSGDISYRDMVDASLLPQ
jgi:NitT/TauT family transport system substrate-binding protein